MAQTKVPGSSLAANLTLGNVIITGTLFDGNGNPYAAGQGVGYTGSQGNLGATGPIGYTGSAGTGGEGGGTVVLTKTMEYTGELVTFTGTKRWWINGEYNISRLLSVQCIGL